MTILRRWLPPISGAEIDPHMLRKNLLTRMLRIAVVVAAPLFLIVSISALMTGNLVMIVVACAFYAGAMFLAFGRQMSYSIQAHGLLVIVFATGLLRMITNGLNVEAGLVFLVYILLVAVLFGLRRGTFALAGTLAAYAVLGFGTYWGIIPTQTANVLPNSTGSADWVLFGLVFTILAVTLGYTLHMILQNLTTLAQQREELAREFETEKTQLQQSLNERTMLLDKRTIDQEAASTIAFELAQDTQMDALLTRTPELIHSLFGYDHIGIFLLDEKEEYAVLQAANSAGGQQLIAAGHRLRRGEEGIVGYVIASSQPRIAQNVEHDAIHFPNPCLPETRSEIALPLKIGDRVIGVLDVQSSESSAFSQNDVTGLQTIADQLAIAINRSRQMEQMQNRMEELESTARQFTRQAWHTYLSSRHQAYGYDAATGQLTDQAPLGPEAQQAIRAGQPIVQTEIDPAKKSMVTNVAVPIKLRDQTLGVLTIHFNSPSVSDEMLSLISATTERMALSLETARLLEEIQVRADREHVISDISAKVRSATDIETILQTTAVELGRKLGLRDVLVQLHPQEDEGKQTV